jgi:formiminotetrahydrofolate cyclodeaminase
MAARAEQQFIVLTDKEGRELNAEILEVAADALKVRRYVDFRIVNVPVNMLSVEDQAFAAYLLKPKAADSEPVAPGGVLSEKGILDRIFGG